MQMAKSQNASEEQGRDNFLSDIKIHKPTAVKILQYWYRNVIVEQNEIKNPKTDMHIYEKLIYKDAMEALMKYQERGLHNWFSIREKCSWVPISHYT